MGQSITEIYKALTQRLPNFRYLVQIGSFVMYSMKKDKYYIYNEKKVEKGTLQIKLIGLFICMEPTL